MHTPAYLALARSRLGQGRKFLSAAQKSIPWAPLMLGYPTTAARLELPATEWPPFSRFVLQAADPVGAISASSLNLSSAPSIPTFRSPVRPFLFPTGHADAGLPARRHLRPQPART